MEYFLIFKLANLRQEWRKWHDHYQKYLGSAKPSRTILKSIKDKMLDLNREMVQIKNLIEAAGYPIDVWEDDYRERLEKQIAMMRWPSFNSYYSKQMDR